MNSDILVTLLASVNALTEAFKRLVSPYVSNEETMKSVSFVASLLFGIGVALASPDAVSDVFHGTAMADNIGGVIVLGLALGFGSKFTYYLVDLISTLRHFTKGKISSNNTSV